MQAGLDGGIFVLKSSELDCYSCTRLCLFVGLACVEPSSAVWPTAVLEGAF